MKPAQALATHTDPIAGVVLTGYMAARSVWPDLEIGEDALLWIAAAGVAVRGLWERRKRVRGREILDTLIDVAEAVRDTLPPDPGGDGDGAGAGDA